MKFAWYNYVTNFHNMQIASKSLYSWISTKTSAGYHISYKFALLFKTRLGPNMNIDMYVTKLI